TLCGPEREAEAGGDEAIEVEHLTAAVEECVGRAVRGGRISDDLAGGVDAPALALDPAEGAEVLQRPAVGAPPDRRGGGASRGEGGGVGSAGGGAGGVEGRAGAAGPAEGAEVLQRSTVGARQERMGRGAARGEV